jgi:gliding motility-associated-like protein
MYLSGNECEAPVIFDNPEATDNCSATVLQTSGPSSGDNLAPGNYQLAFTATDTSGNSATCDFNVEVIDSIAPTITCPEPFSSCSQSPEFEFATAIDNCGIDTIIQTAGPESGGEFNQGFTTVSFQATDVSGNTTTCFFEIEVLQNAPPAAAGLDTNICEATETTLMANEAPDFSTTWSVLNGSGNFDDESSAETELSGLNEGENTFVWSIDPENGCNIATDTVTIIVETDVSVEAGSDELIFEGGDVTLAAQGSPPGGEYAWFPTESLSCSNCPAPNASPGETTLYFVDYTSPLGCTKFDSLFVRAFQKLPNTITPDGDGVNDVWNIPDIADYPAVSVLIFNRWGNKIFASIGYNDPWDGTNNGEDLPLGSYYYIIDYNTQGKENLEGTVNIIR